VRRLSRNVDLVFLTPQDGWDQVNQREEEIKGARADLQKDVEKAITESANNFKQGRQKAESALTDYHAACSKMSQGLEVIPAPLCRFLASTKD
jgi:hypothetical protein